jgi:hypothetical protein
LKLKADFQLIVGLPGYPCGSSLKPQNCALAALRRGTDRSKSVAAGYCVLD